VAGFFDGVVRRAMDEGLASDDHFTVDGTLIRSHASLKSLRPIDANNSKDDREPPADGEGGNPSVNFHGQRRSNATHRSTTDAEARLYRKGAGQPAYLCHSAHAISENRHGLVMAVSVAAATVGSAGSDHWVRIWADPDPAAADPLHRATPPDPWP
jgi:hypothetical protein